MHPSCSGFLKKVCYKNSELLVVAFFRKCFFPCTSKNFCLQVSAITCELSKFSPIINLKSLNCIINIKFSSHVKDEKIKSGLSHCRINNFSRSRIGKTQRNLAIFINFQPRKNQSLTLHYSHQSTI